jgi:alkaline phosphatase
MRSNPFIAAITAAALVFAFAATAVGQTIVNGTFEDTSSGGVAAGWTTYVEPGATINPTIQTANPAEGSQYQQVQVTTENKYAGVRQTITGCTIGTVYTISGFYRTNSLSATASIRVDPAGGTARPATVMASTTSTSFTPFTGNVTAAATSMTIFLDVAVTTINKAGAFDGIVITGGCTPPNAPNGSSANPSTISPGGSSTLAASVNAGETVDWYVGGCGGTLAGTGTTLVVFPTGTTTYYPRTRNTTTNCVSAGCGTPVTVTAPTSNLLTNGGVETWSGTQCANSWTQYNANVDCSKGSTFSGSPSVTAYAGAECQRIMLNSSYEDGGAYQRFPSTPGTHYTVSAWLLTRETAEGAEARLGVDPSGATSPGVNTAWSTRVTGNSPWTQKTMTVTASGSYITVFIHGKHPGTGTSQCNVFFDEAVAQSTPTPPHAKNVILMIGDGMGPEHVQAGSYYLTGGTGRLAFEPYYKCAVTTGSLTGVTDSAAAATALATGHKTNNGIVGQSPGGTIYQSILEYAGGLGKRTGLVTTDAITGATPAGFGAHQGYRTEYLSIGNDYLNDSRPNVMFGGGDPAGGRGYFSASQVTTAQGLGYQVVYNNSQMSALSPSASRALGLFAAARLTLEVNRIPSNPEPHLTQMALKALDIVSQSPNGFFLMIEGANIDETAHDNSISGVTREVVEFHNATEAVLNWMSSRNDTLLIVTADHETGGLDVSWGAQGTYPPATWSSTSHTGANVPLYAIGAGSSMVDQFISGGVMDNTQVFSFMHTALDNEPTPQPPPTVASIAPSSGPDTAVTSITNLAGTGFQTGASVKLSRSGCPDIVAAGVTVVSPTQITCAFNLSGKPTGMWDVLVSNPDGQSSSLPAGFGVALAGSTPVFGTSIKKLLDPVVTTASHSRRVRVWGKVQIVSPSIFWLDDGSKARIRVFAPGYSGLVNGSFASSTGTVDLAGPSALLISSSSSVIRHQ